MFFRVDVYPMSLNCDNICIPSTSKAFDYIAATVSDSDGWIPEYVSIHFHTGLGVSGKIEKKYLRKR